MPEKYRTMLIEGIRVSDGWTNYGRKLDNPFVMAILTTDRHQFKLTSKLKDGLKEFVDESILNLGIPDNSETITQKIIDMDLIGGYYDSKDWIKDRLNSLR